MSVSINHLVWERYPKGGSFKLVLLAMANAASDEGESVYYSVATIASMCNIVERQVQRVLRDLEADNLIEAYAFKKGGSNRATHYRIKVSVLMSMPIRIKRRGGDIGVIPHPVGGGADVTPGVTPVSPEYNNKENNNTAAPDADDDKPPKKTVKAKRGEFHFDKKTPLPDDFYLTDSLKAWGQSKGYPVAALEAYCEQFILTNQANAKYEYNDWEAAFKNWYLRELKKIAERNDAQAQRQQQQTGTTRRTFNRKTEKDLMLDELYPTNDKPHRFDIFEQAGDAIDGDFTEI